MEKGFLVWVKNPTVREPTQDDLWIPGVVVDQTIIPDSNDANVKISAPGIADVVLKIPSGVQETESVKPRNTMLNADEENLQNLPYLNEPEILSHLKSRYENSLIFTFTGPILLALNPFDEVVPSPLCNKLIQRYIDQVRYEAASQGGATHKHSIIISGESGSGKSECCKLILNSLGSRRSMDSSLNAWFHNLVLSNKVLDSFGGARTLKTASSSRFGKVIEMKLNPSGDLGGAEFKTYLLESSRTASQQPNERNFNIFYQLIAGASTEDAKRWKLMPAETYHYINQGGICFPNGKRDDALKFRELKDALYQLGISSEISSALYDLLAGLLALGQVGFEALDDMSGGCRVVNASAEDGPINVAAQMMGVTGVQLVDLFTSKLINTRGEAIKRQLPVAQAKVACDAVAKALYKSVFDWVVATLNERLMATLPVKRTDSAEYKSAEDITIALVDIFGLDALEYNSIDQLCINYANEALHQFFNHHMFKLEIELYKAEDIKYEHFEFPDNQDNLNLIGNGIFKILDDQCRLPNPTDKRLVAQLYKEYSSHPLFEVSTFQQLENKFTLKHFAGPVEYTVDNFIQKNMDNLPTDTSNVLNSAKNLLIVSITQGVAGGRRRGVNNESKNSKTSAPSFVAQVKMDLALLLKEIESTTPHYVKCFKPFDREIDSEEGRNRTLSLSMNLTSIMPPTPSSHTSVNLSPSSLANRALPPPPPAMKGAKKEVKPAKPIQFSQMKVAEQLKYSGILDAVRIGRVGFRTRMPFAEFYNRYRILASELAEVEFEGPRSCGHDVTSDEAKALCFQLIEAICARPVAGEGTSPRPLSRRASRSMSSMLREASIRSLRYVVEGGNIQLGKTLVFMHKKEHDTLETLRNTSLRGYVTLIQKNYRCHYAFMIFRRRMRMFKRFAITIQRKFRAFRFYIRVVRLQCLYRRYIARKKLLVRRERRRRLVALYGPLIQSREMRLKRRRDFVDVAKESINGILVPEIRIAECKIREDELLREILELVAESKVQDGGDFDFYKLIDIMSTRIRALKNNDYKIAMVQFIRALIPAEHMLRTWELTNSSMIGNIMGPLIWKLFYKGDLPEVHLTPRHQMFMPIDKILQKIKHVLSLTDAEAQSLELQRQQMRQFGVSRNASSARRRNSDAMINKISAQIHNILKIQNLLNLFNKYYSKFVSDFCLHFGEGSSYHKSFASEKTYVKDLLEKIETSQINKPMRNEKDNDTLYSVSKCRLKVEWKDTLDNMRVATETNVPTMSRYSLQDDNDVLRKLADLERSRKDFSKDILRIVEFNNVGYQYMPHSPGISFAINSFFNLICERFLPPRRLIKLMGTRQIEGKVAYYQAAPFMSSTSFLDILYNPVMVEQLDSRTYSAAMMTSLILGLTHLQPNHILTSMNKSHRGSLKRETKISVYGFNSDSLMQACFLDFNNPIRNRVHGYNLNVLYFMPQMDEPIDPDVKSFLSSSPFICEELMVSWLRDLFEQNSRYSILKQAGFNSNDFKALNLPILLSKGSINEVYRRLKSVVALIVNAGKEEAASSGGDINSLNREFKLTHQDILDEILPGMSDFYRERRVNSDFTEGIDFKGVVSYAYVYHQALESEKEKVVVRKGNRFSILNIGAAGLLPSNTVSDDGRTGDASETANSDAMDATPMSEAETADGMEEHKQVTSPQRRVVMQTPEKGAAPPRLESDEPVRAEESSETSDPPSRSNDSERNRPVLVAHPSARLSYGNIYDDHEATEGVQFENPPTPFKKIQTNMVLRTSVQTVHHASGEIDYAIFGGGQDEFSSDNLKFVSAPADFKSKLAQIAPRAESSNIRKVEVDGTKIGARVLSLSEKVEDEALDFLAHLDFRDFADIKPIGRAEEFCELVGKNMAFMPSLWLNYIAEWQLKAVFTFWFRLSELGSLETSKLKMKTTEIILRYDSEEDMHAMKDSKILIRLLKKFKIVVKFAIVSATATKPVEVEHLGSPNGRVLAKLASDEQYDVFSFVPTNEDDEEAEVDSEDEAALTAPEREGKKRLMHILWSCENLMQEADPDKLEADIKIIKRVIAQVVVPAAHDVEVKLIDEFSNLLLEFPGLAPIGVVVAERHGFAQHKQILHRLLNHALVERYVDVIIAILECHPEVLVLVDPETSMLPCDRIKKFPDTKLCKYSLLAKFVNFAAEPAQRHFQSHEINDVYDILNRGQGIFSVYRGEEELIVRAAHYNLPVTEMELKVRRYDMNKRCEAKNEPLLLKLLVEDIKGDSVSSAEAYLTFTLFCKAVDERIASGTLAVQDAEDMIWRDIDMNALTPVDCLEYGLNQANLERSAIFQELNKRWNPPVRRLVNRSLSRRISRPVSGYIVSRESSSFISPPTPPQKGSSTKL